MTDRIEILLLQGKSEIRLTHKHVYDEIERISIRLGRDFRQFIVERDGNLYFSAPVGSLHPSKWIYIPRYGTEGDGPDSPSAFALFYLAATGWPLAKQHIEWADFAWECNEAGVGAIIEAARGLGKTIFMRILQAFLIGLYPSLSSVIVRASDGPARVSAERVAGIITDTDAWKLWFPHIRPKITQGQSGGAWSAVAGYSVVDDTVDSKEWAVIEAGRTSHTLTKFGLGGSGILGSRPSLTMLADDIHDDEDNNAPSVLETKINTFQAKLEPACTEGCRKLIIGTPWGLHDLLQILPRTGQWRKIRTPITLEGTYPGTPTWIEMFDEEAITRRYEVDTSPGKIRFKKNYLLDLNAQIDLQINWESFPHRKIESSWLRRIGVDFAELEETASGRGRSYFAALVTAQDPMTGAWIVEDGVVEQVLQERAEDIVDSLHEKYGGLPTVELVCIEAVGGGAVWVQYMIRTRKNMNIIGENFSGIPKDVRWERALAPNLGKKRILISDKQHPFLDQVRIALSQYPNIGKRGDPNADILDAMVCAHWHAFQEGPDPIRRKKRGEKKENPWLKLSKM